MDQVFYFSALVGGTFLVVQTLMLLLGLGGDNDIDAGGDMDVDGGAADAAQLSMIKVLTLKGVVAFLTFFGLSGMIAREGGLELAASSSIGVVAGGAAMFLVAWLMASLNKLHSSGSLDLQNAVGQSARVYLRVPAGGQPGGRVHVNVQGRRIECKAVTDGPELAVGREVFVERVAASGVLSVRAH